LVLTRDKKYAFKIKYFFTLQRINRLLVSEVSEHPNIWGKITLGKSLQE
jgi:hypothetical protein